MMVCPKCALPTRVIDSRRTADNRLRRRRVCNNCSERFTTYEARFLRAPTPHEQFIGALRRWRSRFGLPTEDLHDAIETATI